MSLTTGLPCASFQLCHLQYRSFLFSMCFMYVVFTYAHVCAHMHICVHAFGGQGLMLGVSLTCSSSFIVSHSVTLKLELTDWLD